MRLNKQTKTALSPACEHSGLLSRTPGSGADEWLRPSAIFKISKYYSKAKNNVK